MYRAEVEIYPDASNFAILRHPGRACPGSLVQGDTLHRLWRLAEAARKAADTDADDPDHPAVELAEELRQRLDHYRRVLEAAGRALPFPR